MPTGDDILETLVRETTVQIKNGDGLHMRPAMQFVDLASQFDCEITVSSGRTEADGKSIMNMSMLAATYGTQLKIRAAGPQAEEAIEALRELVEVRMFDEPPPKPNENQPQ
jgi:phosphocarrier protein HPr